MKVANTSLSYNPASQIIGQARDTDAYAFSGSFNVNRSYTTNGLKPVHAGWIESLWL
ncbi:MAG: hypothetical protein WDN31_02125 [Hyphomicrobium sp.]